MRNLQLSHCLRVGETPELADCQRMAIDFDTKLVYCATSTGIYGLDPNTKEVTHQVSLVDGGFLPPDGSGCVVGIEHLPDQTSVCAATGTGDLLLWNTTTNEVECVGSVEQGLTAMCWSSDQELLVLSTGQNTLIMMTREFEPVTEVPMFSDQLGEAQFVNVGWGKKETQFHGSEGKDAAKKTTVEVRPAFDWDDRKPRICWHGDGQYFAVSAVHPITGERRFCMWTREGTLHSTSEAVDGIEQSLGWKSTGNLITTSQRRPNKHDIVFFERNGLRHGEFTLPFGVNEVNVREVLWNKESNILAVWLEDLPMEDNKAQVHSYVQLWTVANYHWYLKQSLRFAAESSSRVHAVVWDQEHAYCLHLLCQGGQYLQYTWSWATNHSVGTDHVDVRNVAVIDGDRVLMTPFRQMVVPPPMAAYHLQLPSPVNQVVFAPPTSPNDIAVLLDDNQIVLFTSDRDGAGKESESRATVKIGASGGNGFNIKCSTSVVRGIYSLEGDPTSEIYPLKFYHFKWIEKDLMFFSAVNFSGDNSVLCTATIDHDSATIKIRSSLDLDGYLFNAAVSAESGHVALQLTDGSILKYDPDSNTLVPWQSEAGDELSFSPWKLFTQMEVATLGEEEVVLGLTDRHQFYVNEIEVATNCTSFALHDLYLLLTTYSHTCRCICRRTKVKVLPTLNDGKAHPFDESVRRVERGSRIVCVVPDDNKLVLQMPRGNLETIHPRALVLSAVRKQLDRLHFKEAFTLMRKHRINMNLIHDHNPDSFLANVDTFVHQVEAPNLINQFLTDLQEDDVTRTMYTAAYDHEEEVTTFDLKVKVNKIDKVCEKLRESLERIDSDRYLLSILTAYVRKSVPELDTALKKVKSLKGQTTECSLNAEDALKYLLFLVDVNELYDVALGTYDFDLVLMIAEKSQKDPKEYIPFLNALRKMEENYQHYTIDKHLKRYSSALQHIVKCGEDHVSECLELIKEQRLYREGLQLYKVGSKEYERVAVEYGSYLLDKNHPEEAGIVLSKASQWQAAVEAFEQGLNWKLALCMACRAGYTGNRVEELCKRLALRLTEQSRHQEAACIYEQHLNDIEEAIVTLIAGSQWEEALRLMHKSNRLDFIETHFNQALMESQSQHTDLLSTVMAEFSRHRARLNVVRTEKERARLHFLEAGDPNTADADLFSDTSSATGDSSISGRSGSRASTDRSSVFSKKTGKSAKTRRKQERKKWSLKEGSVHEDIALVEALSKTCKQAEDWKGDVSSLLKMLMLFHHQREAEQLQEQFEQFLELVEKSIPEIWPEEGDTGQGLVFPTLGPESTANAIAQAMQNQGQRPSAGIQIEPSLRIPPVISKSNTWKLHSSSKINR